MSTLRDGNGGATDELPHAEVLREAMVGELRESGSICSDRVADAFRTVARHLFVPGVSLEEAYANDAVRTKWDENGITISSVISAPWLQAVMLEQAQLRTGMRVLEIGSGGYNAALIANLVGEGGQVTTVDIDPEVTDRARSCARGGRLPGRSRWCWRDAERCVPEPCTLRSDHRHRRCLGHPPSLARAARRGRADRRPPAYAWPDPLHRVRPRRCARLVSGGYHLCGFVPMQGAGAHSERLVPLHGEEVGLRIDGGQQQVDVNVLRDALLSPRVEAWSG